MRGDFDSDIKNIGEKLKENEDNRAKLEDDMAKRRQENLQKQKDEEAKALADKKKAEEEQAAAKAQGDANASSVTTVPSVMTPFKTNLPQDYLIRQEDVVNYKEVENNLFIYSADRDWLKNTTENRYSFSVNFDPANNGQGLYPHVSVQQKFRNIVRIELVKAILPIEGLSTLLQKTADASNNTNYQYNVLSFPYVSVRIPELENNNYGSDNFLDRAFGVLQYDANWYSDPGTTPSQTDSRGFTALIPKFLKS
jgi:hypothetical protein